MPTKALPIVWVRSSSFGSGSHHLGQGLIDRTCSNKPTFHIHQNGLYGGCTTLISPPSATLMSYCTHIINSPTATAVADAISTTYGSVTSRKPGSLILAHMQESVDYSSVPDRAALSRPGPCSFPLRPFAMAISPNPALWAYFEGNAVAIDFESCTFGCFCRIWRPS